MENEYIEKPGGTIYLAQAMNWSHFQFAHLVHGIQTNIGLFRQWERFVYLYYQEPSSRKVSGQSSYHSWLERSEAVKFWEAW